MAYRRLRDERETLGLYLPCEVEQVLQLPHGWCCGRRDLFPPTHLHGRRWCFNQTDVERIRQYISSPQLNHQQTKRDRMADDGWYSIRSAARFFGIPKITWDKALNEGRIPRPSHRVGSNWYYNKEECEAISAQFRRQKPPEGHVSLNELARRAGISPQGLRHYLKSWQDIGTRVGPTRRWYTETDAAEIAKRMAAHVRLQREPPPGRMSTAEAAARLGLDCKQFRQKLRRLAERPGIKIGGWMYFTLVEVLQLRTSFGLPAPVVKM